MKASAKKKTSPQSVRLLVVGTGFGGLGTAIQAKRAGEQDFLVLERAEEVGGVWRDNSYPGCACDVQSHLYSFSFAPNPDWSRDFAPQGEIHDYLKRCARDFDLYPHIRFKTDVTRYNWDEQQAAWLVETSNGNYLAQYLVLACGSLSDPLIPAIPGQETFAGHAFHSARWPGDLELAGKRVAVIGTGASAIQFIPAIQPLVGSLTVFQRTAPWVLPRHDKTISLARRQIFRQFSLLQRARRSLIYVQRELTALGFRYPILMSVARREGLAHMHRAVKGPVLRAKLTPDYTVGCKRVLISDTYYPAMAQPNVSVVTHGVREITPQGVIDKQGVAHDVDVLIYGSGFAVKDLPYSHVVHGRDGQTLADAWQGSPKSLAGTTVHGFPNLFLLHGPNVGLGHSSVIFMLEAQIEHVLSAIAIADRKGCQVLEPTMIAQRRFTHWVDETMQGTVWTSGGCDSWYLDNTGRNSALWPSYTFSFRQRVAVARPEEYRFSARQAS